MDVHNENYRFSVLEPSLMDFILPFNFAKQALYYAPQFGHFYCDSHYKIDRQFVDLYLLVYVCDGELNVNSRGQHIIAKQQEHIKELKEIASIFSDEIIANALSLISNKADFLRILKQNNQPI